jgi:hypothetical protein
MATNPGLWDLTHSHGISINSSKGITPMTKLPPTGLHFFLFFFFSPVLGLGLRAYTLSHSTSPFYQDRVSQTICLGWLRTANFLISASWVAKIIGVSHCCPAGPHFLMATPPLNTPTKLLGNKPLGDKPYWNHSIKQLRILNLRKILGGQKSCLQIAEELP